MNYCIEQGWAFYWGTSEWSGPMLTEAIGIADRLGLIRPVVEQPEYNIFARQRVEVEYDPVYRLSGMGLTVWSPLASGVLTGKYSGKKVPEGSRLALKDYKFLLDNKFGPSAWQIDAADELAPVAAELGCTAAQLALAWCLLNPRVSTVILGATSLRQLTENLGALAVLPKLTPAIVERVESIGGGKGKPAFHSSWTQVSGMRETSKHAYSRGF
jgi:aryl-alcohol dehydrogenase-like predicted oxidoreductase